jgi:hypothetical protein
MKANHFDQAVVDDAADFHADAADTNDDITRARARGKRDHAVVDQRSSDRDRGIRHTASRGVYDAKQAIVCATEGRVDHGPVQRGTGNGVDCIDSDITRPIAGNDNVIAVTGSVVVDSTARNAGRRLCGGGSSANDHCEQGCARQQRASQSIHW